MIGSLGYDDNVDVAGGGQQLDPDRRSDHLGDPTARAVADDHVAGVLRTCEIQQRFGYDDSLDVFGVHGVGGFVGTILAGLFGASAFGGNQVDLAIGRQLGVQLYAALLTAAWSGAASWVLLKAVDAMVGLRVGEEAESQGLDLALHDERGYNM